MEGSDKVRSMGKFRSGEPLVIQRRITKPVDEIVECGADETGVKNRFYFIMFISIDKVWRGSGEIRAVGSGFAIRQ